MNDDLLNKAELNIQAADFLSREGYHPCVCHPAYYSCLQLMKHKIREILGIEYHIQASETSLRYRGNSHAYLIARTTESLKDSIGKYDAMAFNRKIKDLKEMREKADYMPDRVEPDDSRKAIAKAKALRLMINKIKK